MRNTLPKQNGFSSFQVKVHRAVGPLGWMVVTYRKPEDLLVHPEVCHHHLKQPSKKLRNPASLRGTMPVNLWGWFSQQAADGGPCPPTTKSTIYKIYENLLRFAFAGRGGGKYSPNHHFSIQFPDLSLAEECFRNGRCYDSPTLLKAPEEWWLEDDPFLGKGFRGKLAKMFWGG